MILSDKAMLLNYLKRPDGILSSDWAEHAKSKNSLRVRIHQLRKQGHAVYSEPLMGKKGYSRGTPPVRYYIPQNEGEE